EAGVGTQGENASDAGVSPLRRPSFWKRVAATFLRQWLLILTALLLLTVPPLVLWLPNQPEPVPPKQPEAPPARPVPGNPRLEQAKLEAATRVGDRAAVLDYFRRQTPSEKEVESIRGLLKQLTADSFQDRDLAAEQLIAQGP